MARKSKYKPPYVRKYRKIAGLSLRQLENRMEKEPGGESVISHVSIGRIETGKQPWSQEIMEALSNALGVSVAALIEVDPDITDPRVIDMTDRLKNADPAKRDEALRVLEQLLPKVARN